MSSALKQSDARQNLTRDDLRLPSEQQFKRNPIKLIAELTLLPIAAVLVVECFLALANAGQQEYLQPDLKMGMVHIPGKRVTWRMEGYSDDKFNSVGERDIEHAVAKPQGVKRIALVGDSATEGLQVALDDTYARKLQAMLDAKFPKQFEVLNFACASYSTGQQLVKLREKVLQYSPDLTVYLYNRHDAYDSVRDPSKKFNDPRPYFFLDEKGVLRQDDSILEVEKEKLKPNPVLDFLRRNSRIYGVMMQTDLYLGVNEPLYRTIRNGFKAGIQAHPKPEYGLTNAFLVMIELIKNLNSECNAANGQFAVLMFPKTIDDPIFATQGAHIKKEASKEGFRYLDLSPAFNAVADRDKKLYLQVHFSRAGHDLVAKQLFESLYSWNMIDKELKR